MVPRYDGRCWANHEEGTTVTEDRMALEGLVGKADLEVLLREGAACVLDRLMEL